MKFFFNLVDCSSLAAWLHTSMGVWLVWFVPARVGNAAALNILVRNPLPLFFGWGSDDECFDFLSVIFGYFASCSGSLF